MASNELVDYELSKQRGTRWSAQFARDFFVQLPGFLTIEGLDTLRAESERLFTYSKGRDLVMPSEGGGTRRRLRTLGGIVTKQQSPLIANLYNDNHLLDFLSGISSEPMLPVADGNEDCVLNFLLQKGDEHGGHFDTYPFALIIAISVPSPGEGGLAVAEIPKDRPRRGPIRDPLAKRCIIALNAGDAYFLRSDICWHCVTPLTADANRTILNFAYANNATAHHISYSSDILYGSD